MRSLRLTLSFLIVILPLHVKAITPCEQSCYDRKKQCNSYSGPIYNNCGNHLFDCKLSCKGKRHDSSITTLPFEITF
jgi:hypothetical protein